MNTHQPQRESRAQRKRPSALARGAMLLAAAAYFFSALNIAPLVFVWVGLSLDSDHAAQVQNVDGNIRVTLAHPGSHTGHAHQHEWLSRVVVGNSNEGHADHVASFATAGTGVAAQDDGLKVKCPVSALGDFECALITRCEAPVVKHAFHHNTKPLALRSMRPVVMLI